MKRMPGRLSFAVFRAMENRHVTLSFHFHVFRQGALKMSFARIRVSLGLLPHRLFRFTGQKGFCLWGVLSNDIGANE
jgi:hypothetical protein